MENISPTSAIGGGTDPLNAFAELARIVVAAEPADQTLRRIAELAKETLGGVKDVSITVVENGRAQSVVFTGALAVDLDERQYKSDLDVPHSAQLAMELWRNSRRPISRWLRSATDADLRAPRPSHLGAPRTAGEVIRILIDEQTHHGAEIALLRDLYLRR